MSDTVKAVIVIVVGVVVLSLGIYLLSRPVMCEGQEMHPGDICQETTGGSTSDEDYGSRAFRYKYAPGGIVTLAGAGGVIGGAAWAVVDRRKSTRFR